MFGIHGILWSPQRKLRLTEFCWELGFCCSYTGHRRELQRWMRKNKVFPVCQYFGWLSVPHQYYFFNLTMACCSFFLKKKFLFLFIFSLVFCLHVCLCDGVRSSGIEVIDRYELPYGCWDLNPGHLEEQPELLTAEPSFQPRMLLLKTLLNLAFSFQPLQTWSYSVPMTSKAPTSFSFKGIWILRMESHLHAQCHSLSLRSVPFQLSEHHLM